MGMGSFIVRSGIVIGTVYYTKRIGIWGSSHQTEAVFDKIVDGLRPHVERAKRQLPFQVPSLPQRAEVRFLTKHYYNEGVKGSFHFVQMLPCYTGQLLKNTKDTIAEFIAPPPPAKQTKTDAPNVKQESTKAK